MAILTTQGAVIGVEHLSKMEDREFVEVENNSGRR